MYIKRKFEFIAKTGIYAVKAMYQKLVCKISNQYPHFCLYNSRKKLGKPDDVTFWNAIFVASNRHTPK